MIEADEGRDLREKLMSNSLHMRQRMAETNFTVLGQPSAIIPVLLGDSALSRLANHYAYNEGQALFFFTIEGIILQSMKV